MMMGGMYLPMQGVNGFPTKAGVQPMRCVIEKNENLLCHSFPRSLGLILTLLLCFHFQSPGDALAGMRNKDITIADLQETIQVKN